MSATYRNSARLLLVAAVTFALSATAAGSDTVKIIADDGKVQVSGQVTAVLEQAITIKTDAGLLTFDMDTVRCEGIGCPRLSLDKVQTTVSVIR